MPLPWTTQFNVVGNKVFVISAQSPGSITCTILVDGKVVSQATASGAPARTVCSPGHRQGQERRQTGRGISAAGRRRARCSPTASRSPIRRKTP